MQSQLIFLQDQAFDRAHRYGQTRDVNIFKLKIDETVEDRILLVSTHPISSFTSEMTNLAAAGKEAGPCCRCA